MREAGREEREGREVRREGGRQGGWPTEERLGIFWDAMIRPVNVV